MLKAMKERFLPDHIIALIAFAVLVIAAVMSVDSLALNVSASRDEVERKRILLGRMEQVVNARLAEAQNDAASAMPPFFVADNSSAAAAQLQDHLVRQLQSLNIVPSVVEVQARDIDPGLPATLGRVQVSAEFDFYERDTGNILKMAEGNSPELKIDTLEIRGAASRNAAGDNAAAADGWRRLTASVAISGYWVSGDAK